MIITCTSKPQKTLRQGHFVFYSSFVSTIKTKYSRTSVTSWWFQPTWKISYSQFGLFFLGRGENKKYLKPPPRWHLNTDSNVRDLEVTFGNELAAVSDGISESWHRFGVVPKQHGWMPKAGWWVYICFDTSRMKTYISYEMYTVYIYHIYHI